MSFTRGAFQVVRTEEGVKVSFAGDELTLNTFQEADISPYVKTVNGANDVTPNIVKEPYIEPEVQQKTSIEQPTVAAPVTPTVLEEVITAQPQQERIERPAIIEEQIVRAEQIKANEQTIGEKAPEEKVPAANEAVILEAKEITENTAIVHNNTSAPDAGSSITPTGFNFDVAAPQQEHSNGSRGTA